MNPTQAKKVAGGIPKSRRGASKSKSQVSVSTTGNHTLTGSQTLFGNGTPTTTTSTATGGVYVTPLPGSSTLGPGVYSSNLIFQPPPQARVSVLGRQFDLADTMDPAVVASLVGFLGIGYYVHLKESGFPTSVLPQELADHLDALVVQHTRSQRIKKTLDEDAGA